jgi:hypothetical protein
VHSFPRCERYLPATPPPTAARQQPEAIRGQNILDETVADNLAHRANLPVKNLLNKYYIQYLDTLPNPGLTVVGSIIVRFASRLRPGEVIARPNFGFGRASAT